MTTLLEVSDLHKSFTVSAGVFRTLRHEVLKGVNLHVDAGEIVGLVGESGSGKTTLIRAVVGVQVVRSGTVTVLGEPAGSASLRRRIGYSSAALTAQLRGELSVIDVVMTARYAALEPWWHTYDDADRRIVEAYPDREDGDDRRAPQPEGRRRQDDAGAEPRGRLGEPGQARHPD